MCVQELPTTTTTTTTAGTNGSSLKQGAERKRPSSLQLLASRALFILVSRLPAMELISREIATLQADIRRTLGRLRHSLRNIQKISRSKERVGRRLHPGLTAVEIAALQTQLAHADRHLQHYKDTVTCAGGCTEDTPTLVPKTRNGARRCCIFVRTSRKVPEKAGSCRPHDRWTRLENIRGTETGAAACVYYYKATEQLRRRQMPSMRYNVSHFEHRPGGPLMATMLALYVLQILCLRAVQSIIIIISRNS